MRKHLGFKLHVHRFGNWAKHKLVTLRPASNNRFETKVRIWHCSDCECFFWLIDTDSNVICAGCHAQAKMLATRLARDDSMFIDSSCAVPLERNPKE